VDLVNLALIFMGTPYVWGGNDITKGVDCSGFVCEITRSVGLLDDRDLTAQGLYDYYVNKSRGSGIDRNSLLFFGRDNENITHVAIAINYSLMVEAGGEGRIDTDNGYVRIRPVINRRDLVAAIKLEEL